MFEKNKPLLHTFFRRNQLEWATLNMVKSKAAQNTRLLFFFITYFTTVFILFHKNAAHFFFALKAFPGVCLRSAAMVSLLPRLCLTALLALQRS